MAGFRLFFVAYLPIRILSLLGVHLLVSFILHILSKLVSLCRNPISIVYVVYSIKLAKTDILLTMHNDILKILKCIEKKL